MWPFKRKTKSPYGRYAHLVAQAEADYRSSLLTTIWFYKKYDLPMSSDTYAQVEKYWPHFTTGIRRAD